MTNHGAIATLLRLRAQLNKSADRTADAEAAKLARLTASDIEQTIEHLRELTRKGHTIEHPHWRTPYV